MSATEESTEQVVVRDDDRWTVRRTDRRRYIVSREDDRVRITVPCGDSRHFNDETLRAHIDAVDMLTGIADGLWYEAHAHTQQAFAGTVVDGYFYGWHSVTGVSRLAGVPWVEFREALEFWMREPEIETVEDEDDEDPGVVADDELPAPASLPMGWKAVKKRIGKWVIEPNGEAARNHMQEQETPDHFTSREKARSWIRNRLK